MPIWVHLLLVDEVGSASLDEPYVSPPAAGHRRSRVAQCGGYVSRRWVTDDRGSGGPPVRLAPVGHRRSQVTRAAQTSCAGGSHTTTGHTGGTDVMRRWVTDDRRAGGQPVRSTPVGHRRTPTARRAGTLCAGWLQMATDQADSRYVVRRRVIDDRRLRERRVRFAPVGHTRPRIRRTAGTSCAGGSHTTTDQAGDGYVSRPWVTDERRSRGRRERCAPAGHRRPQDCRRKGPVSLVWVGNSQTQLLVIAHLFE